MNEINDLQPKIEGKIIKVSPSTKILNVHEI
jgi:hypothetical protein